MKLLAVDTTTTRAGVALLDGETLVAARRAVVTTHSEMLLPMIRDVLDEARVVPAALDVLACAAGPGSFTGLRIGLATVKGLCFALARPLVLVSSLEALAARGRRGGVVVGTVDAFKCEVYAGVYRSGWPPELVEPEVVLAPERLAERLAALVAGGGPVELIGDAVARWQVLRVAGVETSDVEPPDAADVARLAALRFARGERADVAAATPRYIRPSEAELMSAAARKP